MKESDESEINYQDLLNYLICLNEKETNMSVLPAKQIRRNVPLFVGSYKKPDYDWTKVYYAANKDVLQVSHMTKPERFPTLFDRAKELYPDAKRLLSFGCSTGEEAQALAKRFPEAEIVGYDIDHFSVQTARKNNKSDKIFFTDCLEPTGTYDIMTVCMVLFLLEKPIPKDRWIATINKLDKHINPGGIIMIFTSDYDPEEILTADKYEAINVWQREHNKKKDSAYFNGYYRRKA